MKRRIILETLPTSNPDITVQMALYYHEKKISASTGKKLEGGYSLDASVMEARNGAFYVKSAKPRAILVKSDTYSEVRLELLAAEAKESPLYQKVFGEALAKYGLDVAPPKPAVEVCAPVKPRVARIPIVRAADLKDKGRTAKSAVPEMKGRSGKIEVAAPSQAKDRNR